MKEKDAQTSDMVCQLTADQRLTKSPLRNSFRNEGSICSCITRLSVCFTPMQLSLESDSMTAVFPLELRSRRSFTHKGNVLSWEDQSKGLTPAMLICAAESQPEQG